MYRGLIFYVVLFVNELLTFIMFFYVLLTVYLSIILANDQLNAQILVL